MRNGIEQKVLEYIEKQKLFQSGSRVLLSLSAGKDSMALLHIICAVRPCFSLDVELFHLNHCTRGEESDGDEQFLRETAQRFDIPITIKRMDVRKSRPGGHSFEEHARAVRYELLSECARERHCDVIATAHTRDDSIETIIMRIFQGTGIHGLRGIEPRRDTIVRPLLCLSSEEVLAFLRERDISWREDATNVDIRFLRNYVRQVLIPVVKKRFPDYASALMRLANISRDEQALLDELAQKLYGTDAYQRRDDGIIIAHEAMRGNEALIKHLMARAFHELGGYTSSRMLDDIMKKMQSSRAHRELFRGRGLCAMKTKMRDTSCIRVYRDADAKPLKDWEFAIPLSDIPKAVGPDAALFN
jgi:tRNA(Ile)-lysidine synthase